MSTHLWVFPWLAMLCGIAALLVGLIRAHLPLHPSKPDAAFLGRFVVWLVGTAVLFWTALQVGDKAGVDVIPARGILLGGLAGAVVAVVSGGKPPASPWARPLATIGAATAFLAAGLLWLTHGEVSGLTAVATTAVFTLLCFRLGADDDNSAVISALYLSTVATAMQLGYSRTDVVSDAYWPYLPLVMSGAVCLGLLVASAIRSPVPAAAALIVVLGLGACALNKLLVHDITVVKIAALGLAAFAVIVGTSVGTTASRSSMAPMLVGLVAVVLAYTYWAGYGIALMAVAGWAVVIAVNSGRDPSNTSKDAPSPAVAVLAFALLVMLQRLVSLQGSSAVSSVDPTDTWSLLALGFGAFLPQLAGRWLAASGTGTRPLMPLVFGVVLLIGAPALVAFLFATHAAAELLLGVALGVVAVAAGPAQPVERRALLAAGAFAGLFLLLLMPLSSSWKEPTRRVRLEALAGLAIVAVAVRLLDRRETAPEES